MCVIAVVETGRPTDEHIEKMFQANSHGGGVAWRADGRVNWEKGLGLDEMLKYNKELPIPYVLHFRVPSNNTSQSIFACHPFPVEPHVSTALRGSIGGFVLFHNGHWHDWRKKLEDFSCRGGWKIPSGPWSDSRALAWTANHMGFGMLELIDEKVVAFGPGEDELELFGMWQKFDLGTGEHMLVSNTTWDRPVVDYRLPHTYRDPKETAGGTSQISQFHQGSRATAGTGEGGKTEQTKVQEGHEVAGGGAGQAGGTKAEAETVVPFPRPLMGDLDTVIEVGRGAESKCRVCGTSKAGVEENGIRYCWQCWSVNAKATQSHKPESVLCQLCWSQIANKRLVSNHTRICGICWHKRGAPPVVALAVDMVH